MPVISEIWSLSFIFCEEYFTSAKANFKTIQKMVVLWLNRGIGMVCLSSELTTAAQFPNKGKNFLSKNFFTFFLQHLVSKVDFYLWLRGACLWGSMGRYLLDTYLIPHVKLSLLVHQQSHLDLHTAKTSSASDEHGWQRILALCTH